MKKKLFFVLLLFSKSVFCMNDQEEKSERENLLASQVDLEQGLQLKDCYDTNDKKIVGLLKFLKARNRQQNKGSNTDALILASNLEKLSDQLSKELTLQNNRITQTQNCLAVACGGVVGVMVNLLVFMTSDHH